MAKVLDFINKNSSKLLAGLIIIYIIIFSAICIWKYSNFLYAGLDLGIINNVFFNTLNGSWFWSSIQGHSYLGDHFTPILILLLPIYYLWQSPETLLILQSLFLGLASIPIFKIGNLILRDRIFSLGVALLWLINPLVHNINLYEFHFISVLPLAFFTLFYLYLRIKDEPSNRKLLYCYIVILLLLLMIREDVAFILLVFSLIILLTNLKNRKLILVSAFSFLASVFWLLLSTKIISYFSPSNFSPFAYYYEWLFNSNLLEILNHTISLTNFEMLVGFLLPFLFIPLIKPKWLLLALIPFGQIILSRAGGGALVWQMHYAALFLPAIVIAFIYSFTCANDFIQHLLRIPNQFAAEINAPKTILPVESDTPEEGAGFINKKLQGKYLLLIILCIVNLYLWMDFGIWKNSLERIKKAPNLNLIEADSSVIASLNYLPNLSSRENVYSLHYYFLGVQQFDQGEYVLSSEPEYIVLDKNDYEYYDKILKTSAWAGVHYLNGYQRLDKLFADYQLIEEAGQVSLFKKAAQR